MTPREPTFRSVAGVRVVSLADDVDLAVAGGIEAVIRDRTDAQAPLVVDLTEVSFVDSSGVRMLDRLVGRQGAAGAPMRVVAPEGGSPRFSLRMCEFPPDLLAETVDDAVRTLTS